jgi:predicted peptidase
MKHRTLLLAGVLTCPGGVAAQAIETGFLDRSVSLDKVEYVYQVYVPRAYRPSEEWPVILFLHGAGERGDDGLFQTQVGLGSAIRANAERWPAIAVFPQAPEEMTWQGTPGQVAMAALDATLQEFRVDESRVYLTGLSLGGNGTWYLAYSHADRFAALVAICSFVEAFPGFPRFIPESSTDPYSTLAASVADVPVWIVHGDADEVVPVEESRRMAAALEEAGADVRYEELRGVGHNAWDPAYASEELAVWLFSQQRQ